MTTKLLYLTDMSLTQAKAKVLAVLETEKGLGIVLDQSIFYVQGGGQPSDTGYLTSEKSSFEVQKVIRTESGLILHLGIFGPDSNSQKLEIEEEVILSIDVAKRQLHSRIHSAGHLFDLSVQKVGLDWKPGKGYHFPDGPYVEYSYADELSEVESLKQAIQTEFDRLVQADLPVEISFDSEKLFHGEPLRVQSFGSEFSCPCGGTHVETTSELAGFAVDKIKAKNGVLRLSYKLK